MANDYGTWLQAGPRPPKLAVNVSASQLRRPDFVQSVQRALEAGASPAGIEIEVTESVLMDDIGAGIRKLQFPVPPRPWGRYRGFRRGLSSLSQSGAASGRCADASQAVVVRAIISLGHLLRMKVIAEGVENEPQAQMLGGLGCDLLQGYWFGKPMTSVLVTRLLDITVLRT